MGLNSAILKIKDPEVPIRRIEVADSVNPDENQNFPQKTGTSSANPSKVIGSQAPHAQIGDFMISGKNVVYMCIDETGFLPTIRFTFTDKTGVFNSMHFPKHDMILSIYIKSVVDTIKPIRTDFIITNIRGTSTPNDNGINAVYTLTGEIFAPELYNNVIKSYSQVNSHDALLAVAEETGLGFAENEASASDKMTWINPNWNRIDFIKYVTKHAYKDDDSFFTTFIDNHYMINYVNVNNQFEQDQDLDTTAIVINEVANYNDSTPSSINETETTPVILTNHPNFKGGTNFILDYCPKSDHGDVLKYKGYKKRIYYYDYSLEVDDPSEKFLDFYAAPISTGNTQFGGGALLPENETLQNNEVRKWTHINYGNTHAQYIPAKLINSHNLAELKKIQLHATSVGINFGIQRGARVPVLIVIPEPDFKQRFLPRTDDPEALILKRYKGQVVEQWLTDFYYVSGIKYIYDPLRNPEVGTFFTEFELAKRDWRSNPSLYE